MSAQDLCAGRAVSAHHWSQHVRLQRRCRQQLAQVTSTGQCQGLGRGKALLQATGNQGSHQPALQWGSIEYNMDS